ncbi:hypothetical protein [Yinghuangia sp. YIM S10712]|uniref:hypothetical protein n=1 Tax=Yinghuangia sp. YIM S10712 TaxID=3436930 RepID=UPI003F535C95
MPVVGSAVQSLQQKYENFWEKRNQLNKLRADATYVELNARLKMARNGLRTKKAFEAGQERDERRRTKAHIAVIANSTGPRLLGAPKALKALDNLKRYAKGPREKRADDLVRTMLDAALRGSYARSSFMLHDLRTKYPQAPLGHVTRTHEKLRMAVTSDKEL